jgi:protocatechuate 3,4-dioxygenase beta subunit
MIKSNEGVSANASNESVSRRAALKFCLVPLAGLAAERLLVACSSGGAQARSGAVADGGTTADAGGEGSGLTDTSSVPWASGGTKAIKGGYPDPFANGGATSCALTRAMILGPCYAATLERQDISEGAVGVPMRVSLLVVREDGCTPVAGATVDVWHTNASGVYSTYQPGTTCNPGSEDETAWKFCRGVQTTDANGRVDFDSVVPGWYKGRAVHLHFTVRENGVEYVTSQFFFDDALLDDIEQQVDYKARGLRDTRNSQDGVLPANDTAPYLFETAKRADGALHAWKVITLRKSLDEALPSAGGTGQFGDGGPPPFPDGGFPEGGFPGFPGAGPAPFDGGSE